MFTLSEAEITSLYSEFHQPIAFINCGDQCAPYNQKRVPFCCDTRHAIPTAYLAEWEYLQENTDLWHRWQSDRSSSKKKLVQQTPPGHVLIECKGHTFCQRAYRSLTCRAFPFFPYIDQDGDFIGMSYYWEYEDRCWIISNLSVVSLTYLNEFIATYEKLFSKLTDELEIFKYQTALMRRTFKLHKRAIPLLHRNGFVYKISPHNGRMRRIAVENLPKFGVYQIAAKMPFPDELIAHDEPI